jgi:hypothetical protein
VNSRPFQCCLQVALLRQQAFTWRPAPMKAKSVRLADLEKAVAQTLGHDVYTLPADAAMSLGCVLLQLMLHQLKAMNLQPTFKQPVPWSFLPSM